MVQIIGAGMGRTSTMSLKQALEMLGFRPCHHMMEMRNVPETAEGWLRAAQGEAVDFAALLKGYRASCDWPSSAFWRELMQTFPDAKVILTERPEEKWWQSISRTIFQSLRLPPDPDATPTRPVQRAMAKAVIIDKVFGGEVDDREHVLSVYRAHNAAVKAEVPVDKLLVFDGADGWAPLCAFLGVPVPDEAYPNTNSTADFQARWTPDQRAAAGLGS
ncbi:MAG: sulfotransferase family protein [Alphaproteobacteria bacterium]|nr:sulfotransferase family protein [Alphaproteobacteria bacterium]MCB9930724.1 sulfotransferase family protein [Alphaproteobacteria bacterium]